MKTRRAKPKPTGGDEGGVLLGLRLPHALHAEIAHVADRLGITPQAWIGMVVRQSLRRKEGIAWPIREDKKLMGPTFKNGR